MLVSDLSLDNRCSLVGQVYSYPVGSYEFGTVKNARSMTASVFSSRSGTSDIIQIGNVNVRKMWTGGVSVLKRCRFHRPYTSMKWGMKCCPRVFLRTQSLRGSRQFCERASNRHQEMFRAGDCASRSRLTSRSVFRQTASMESEIDCRLQSNSS